jgi:hypothetical protein
MKKKLAPFISGTGIGLCLAAMVMTLWGLVWADQESVQAKDPDQGKTVFSDTDSVAADSPASAEITRPDSQEAGMGLESKPPVQPKEVNKVVKIKTGMSAKQIAELLAAEGIIGNAQQFYEFAAEQKKTRKFRAGEFTLHSGMSHVELLKILTS